ncbi:MAG TPA: hypothetical protein VD867_12860 [Burkholderiales bacterium]|nr:hypothetical protein [Burkholderiales bacterium]
MSRAYDLIQRRDSVTVPKIWVAAAVSILIHMLAMWQWKPELRRPSDLEGKRDERSPLVVQIVPERRMRPPTPPPSPRQPPVRETRPPQQKRAPAPPPRVEPRPPILSLPRPEASPVPSAPPAPSRPPPAQPPAARTPPTAGDLLAYVEAQRRARNVAPPATPPQAPAPAGPAESDNARASRLAAANLGLGNKPAMGADPRRGGGIFEIQRIGYDYAEFAFYGWNKEMRRNTAQVIEVRKGSHSDIRIAVVRRMIAIIRDHEQADFAWESHRLGRLVTLSARQRDSTGLEEFMMREFFEAPPPARR